MSSRRATEYDQFVRLGFVRSSLCANYTFLEFSVGECNCG